MNKQLSLILLLITLTVSHSTSATKHPLRGNELKNQYLQRNVHRELSSSWWTSLMTHLHHIGIGCPPHESKDCPKNPGCSCSSSSSSSSSSGSGGKSGGKSSGSGGKSGGKSSGSGGSSGGSNNNDDPDNIVTDDYAISEDDVNGDDNTTNIVDDEGWGDDGYKYDDGNISADGHGYDYDDGEQYDGWEESALGNGQTVEIETETVKIWPFLVGALVAGVLGAAFVATRRKRDAEGEDHPLDGIISKKMRTFGVFGRHVQPSLDLNDEDKPAFVEINEIKKNPSIVANNTTLSAPSYERPVEVTRSQSVMNDTSYDDSEGDGDNKSRVSAASSSYSAEV
eukprot:CAMPEP_0171339322 /NCGR_PEP_ID=MMETSP0878-20121228/7879_1 /TAXON_ID=67004 /ORGANISM="Thalassiosira weissflogii, Strain CCMP1336" /LENGTH=338 /DNA_ID=CAMNT_0011841229 /DNA_START=132 /DNA_END=1148 /DNA_ORIENTATION=-